MMKRKILVFTLLLANLTCVLRSQSQAAADMILFNGKVWTGEQPARFVEAVAIKGNRIEATGSLAQVRSLAGTSTRMIDLKGRLVVAGFNDAHTHFLSGSLGLTQVDLNNAASANEAVQRVAEYARKHPEKKWITGMGWLYSIFEDGRPTKELLDKAVPDRPIFLSAYDGHSAWVNSKALEMAGINSQTNFDGFGSIVKNDKGEPTGMLLEGAQQLVRKLVPRPTREEQLQALRLGMQYAASLGITSIQNASGSPDEFSLYEELLRNQQLTLRASTAFSMGKSTKEEDIAKYATIRDRYVRHPQLRASSVKFLVDGVIESHTAAMLEPYADTNIRGELALPEDVYSRLVTAADKAGFQVYTHAIGDRGVRVALDAYEAAMRANGKRDSRHRVEHVEQCKPEDVLRFAKLGVIASMEPIHADPGTVAVWEKAVGPQRLPYSFAWASMLQNKVKLVYSSDWPACITPDPIRGLHVAVNRQTTDGKPAAGWVPEQRIALTDALVAYTQGGAYSSFDEQQLGKIAKGYLADIIVLSQDLFTIPPSEIHNTRVQMTIANGKVVYEKP